MPEIPAEHVDSLLDTFMLYVDQGLSQKTLDSYRAAARRLLNNASAEIRNANDRRALTLLVEFIGRVEKELADTFKSLLSENIAMGAIEHPRELEADSLMVDRQMVYRLQQAEARSAALLILEEAGATAELRRRLTAAEDPEIPRTAAGISPSL